ncbi:MAG: efflux RND transporter permease subunit [Acidiferrobacterales bacterium]
MSITAFAIEKNRITAVALVCVFVAGIISYIGLPRAEDPGFVVRAAQVTTRFPGASPERVEQLISDKLEKVIQEIPQLDYVKSQSKDGVSVITVNIHDRYKKMRPIWDDLRRKVEKVQPDLPDGSSVPFVNDEFGDVFGTIVMITGEGFSYAELKDVADEVRDELLRIDEVAKVEIYGAQEERVFVEYNNARLAELGLSPILLKDSLETRNIIIPGGSVTTGIERIMLEPSGNFESVDDVRRSILQLPGRKEVVYLEDIARVTRGYVDPPLSKMRASGVPSLGLAVSLREGGNIITLGENVKTLINRMQTIYPIGIEFDFVQVQAEVVDKKIDDFASNLLQAVAIVMLVMLITLGLRTGLIVASLIPMAMIASLMIMGFLGIGLNQMSLAALIISLGMLVDNAIVMAESIMVQMQAGKRPFDAAVDSAAELRVPLLTSSLTTAAAFLPIFLAKSTTGEYTAPLFKVVTVTLLSSWFLALTMIPMLCVYFMRVKTQKKGDPYDSRFYSRYRGFLITILKHPWLTLSLTALVFIVAMQGFGLIPNIFFPPNDRATFTAELRLPVGSDIERTEAVVRQIEDYMKAELVVTSDRPQGITNWAAFVGRGAPRFILPYNPEPPSPEYAILIVNATSRQIIDRLVPRLDQYAFENFPDLDTKIRPLQLGPMIDNPIEVRISGRDTDRIFSIVDRVKAQLHDTPGVKYITDDWGSRSKKMLVRVNQPRARRAGVTNQDVATSLQSGLTGIETTEYREDDKVIPVTLRSVASDRQDIGKIETLNVFVQSTGRSVPLKQVADVEIVWQPAKIWRRQRLRTVTVQAGLEAGVTATEVTDQLVPWLDREKANWGHGYSYELGGEHETSGKANASIAEQLPVAGIIILLLLVGQFNSIRRPIIILTTIPLALIGVVVGLLALRSYFGFMTLLGIISLAGIVINNAIVLLDRIRIEIQDNGLERPRAIVEATQRRLRPILLTTATTVTGLTPLYVGGGPMWEPMAITIMFGLLFSTVLTLGVVPVLYSRFFHVSFKGFKY